MCRLQLSISASSNTHSAVNSGWNVSSVRASEASASCTSHNSFASRLPNIQAIHPVIWRARRWVLLHPLLHQHCIHNCNRYLSAVAMMWCAVSSALLWASAITHHETDFRSILYINLGGGPSQLSLHKYFSSVTLGLWERDFGHPSSHPKATPRYCNTNLHHCSSELSYRVTGYFLVHGEWLDYNRFATTLIACFPHIWCKNLFDCATSWSMFCSRNPNVTFRQNSTAFGFVHWS